MRISCIFKQAFCLISLFFLTCDSKDPLRRKCSFAIMTGEIRQALNKTAEFKRHFPDDITNIRLLTSALKKEFRENCSTRHHLLAFYTDDILSADMVLAEAQKSGIRENFLKIADMFRICQSSKCQSTEETEGIKDLRKIVTQITLKQKLHKAISEIHDLIMWINSFFHKGKSTTRAQVTSKL